MSEPEPPFIRSALYTCGSVPTIDVESKAKAENSSILPFLFTPRPPGDTLFNIVSSLALVIQML